MVRSCQHSNRPGSRFPRRCYVECGIADHDDFRGGDADSSREGEDRPGAGLAPKPEFVSRDKGQDVVEAQLAHMSKRGSFGIIGDQAKLIAAAGELVHNGLGIADGREMGCRRFAQKSVDLRKKCQIGTPSQQCRPARRKDARRLIDQRRVGPEACAIDKAALCGKLAVKAGVATR